MKSYKQFKSESLKDSAIRREYEKLGPEFELIQKLIENRLSQNMTQAELAQKIGTKQSAISRFESGDVNPTLEFLYKLADGLNVTLKVTVS